MKSKIFNLAIVTFLLFASVTLKAYNDGDADGWWDIDSYADLYTLSVSPADWTLNFELTDTIYVPSGQNFSPIGTVAFPFRGSFRGKDPFDGVQYKIVGLAIDRPSNDAIGLFGVNMGTITDLIIYNFDITGKNQVGAICGLNEGTINHCEIYFDIPNANYIDTQVWGDTLVGGLVGLNGGTISNCYLTRTKLVQYTYVTVVGNCKVGGCVGANNSISPDNVSNNEVYNAEVFSMTFPNDIGGFAGYNEGVMGNCSVAGLTSIWDSMNGLRYGGLVGNNNGGTISSCQVGDSVIVGTDYYRYAIYAGGFAGKNTGTIEMSSSGAWVYAKSFIGGFIGLDSGIVSDCHSSGKIIAKLGTYGTVDNVGGFVGCDKGFITHCYVSEAAYVFAPFSNWVGGFTGRNVGDIEFCCAKDSILGHWTLGGFMGACFGTVHDCYSRGDIRTVFPLQGDSIGGFVGVIEPSGSIENCFSTADTINGTAPGAFAQYCDFGYWNNCVYDLICNELYYGIAVGWTTFMLKNSSRPYQYWDFTNVWEFDANQNDGYLSFIDIPVYKINFAQKDNIEKISIYPNPVTEVSTININRQEKGFATISIYNTAGEKIENIYSGDFTENEYSMSFDGSNYSTGLYYLILESNNDRIMKPIVVQH